MAREWGKMQKECHKMLGEVFEDRREGYKWLSENFKINHFSDLKWNEDIEILREIHAKLYIKSLTE